MSDAYLNHLAIEEAIAAQFGLRIEIGQMIAQNIPTGRSGSGYLFLTKKKQLFLFLGAEQSLLLSDVKKIVSRMGLVAEKYTPPKNQLDYFEVIGRQKFAEIFPGRSQVSSDDIAFYKTLAPYNPGLVLIREVKQGIVYQWDADTKNSWRPSVKFAYRRIATS